MTDEAFVGLLKEALEECGQVKEFHISQCDFDAAARFRDYGDALRKIIASATGVDKLMLLHKSKTPLKQCKHLELNQVPMGLQRPLSCDTDVRQVLDLEAKEMGYADYEDLELSIIREVGECGPSCVWWGWRQEIIKRRQERNKSLTERQPDWKPEDLMTAAK